MVAIPEQRVGELLETSSSGFISAAAAEQNIPPINRKNTILAVTIIFQVSSLHSLAFFLS